MSLSRCVTLLCVLVLGTPVLATEFDPWNQSARYQLEYRIDLGAWAAGEKGSVRVWVPAPAENDHQRVQARKVDSPWPVRETEDGFGNRFVYCEPGGAEGAEGELALRYVVERMPFRGVGKSDVRSGTPLDPRRHLGPQRRIPVDGRIHALAEEKSRGLETDGQKIRAFYDHVTSTMRYSKDGEGWGRGDALWACDSKYGNCTDFHSVLIGLARSEGIPARFVMGFPIDPNATETDVSGYHCWAEIYDPDRGWLPIDASEAWKAKRFDDFFGQIPSDRIEFTVGRDLTLEPPQKGEPLNYFIYPYAEVNGKPAEEVPWKLHVRRLSTKTVGE